MSEFMGKSFIWFVGVVEDRADPKHLGRLRVRCLGYHTEDLLKLPTADLPWAHPMNPVTSATVSGVGQTPLGAVEGTWVVGFFQDGADAQMPIIIGTLPGVPSELPTKIEPGDDGEYAGKGFQDYVNANYPKYMETDMNRLAVNEKESDASGITESETNPHPSLIARRADLDTAVGTAQIDGIREGIAQIPEDLDEALETTGQWDEPTLFQTQVPDPLGAGTYQFTAKYPNNHVYESEGGHLREMDDTEGAERIHERHASGTGYEIGPEGTKVTRVKKDNYTIISDDDYCHIQGTGRTTIEEGLRVRVNADGKAGNNYNIEVGQGSNVNIEVNGGSINLTTLASGMDSGDINLNTARDLNIQIARNFNVAVLGNAIENITGKKDELVVGKNTKTGSEINLN